MTDLLYISMGSKNELFSGKWDIDKKEQKRVTLTKEVLDFVNKCAFEDFGFTKSSFSKEMNKLILIAKDCLERQKKD